MQVPTKASPYVESSLRLVRCTSREESHGSKKQATGTSTGTPGVWWVFDHFPVEIPVAGFYEWRDSRLGSMSTCTATNSCSPAFCVASTCRPLTAFREVLVRGSARKIAFKFQVQSECGVMHCICRRREARGIEIH